MEVLQLPIHLQVMFIFLSLALELGWATWQDTEDKGQQVSDYNTVIINDSK